MFNIIGFLTYAFVVSFTPGPNNITSMALASQHGYRKTLRFMLGVATGFFLIMLLSGYFNLFLLSTIPRIKNVMSLFGIFYMLFLALKILGVTLPWHKSKNKSTSEPLGSFKMGVLLQFFNPKAIIYGITIVSTFITPYFRTPLALFAFSILLSLIALASTSCWAIFGSLFNRFLAKHQKPFNAVMALLLLYVAYTIFTGLFH